MRELLCRGGHELLDLIDSGDVHPHELLAAQLGFAREADARLNAFVSWGEAAPPPVLDLALEGEGPRRFSRLPYAAKDIFTTRGLRTTAGSRVLGDYLPPYDATCIAALRQSRSQLVGKTNLDEFAMGSSGETSAFGPTRNPWGPEYVPGGSSSGSAAAVAACQAVMALGTDTGGSIRQPASFCGIVGYKPTYGLVSRSGLIAYSSSCDTPGVFTRCALDAALAMNTISTEDPLDSTCAVEPGVDYYAAAQREVHWEKLRVGVIRQFASPQTIDAPVLENFKASLQCMTDAGASLVELDFGLADLCLPAYYIITAAECSSNLARFDGVRYGLGSLDPELKRRYFEVRQGFGSEVKRRILLGTYVLSAGYAEAYYDRARRLRAAIRQGLQDMFSRVDIIATPTSPTLPFKIGARSQDPVRMYLADLCTVYVNLAGLAGISLPNGFGEDAGVRLPTGIQFASAAGRDTLLLRVAHQFEQLCGWRYCPPQWVRDALGAG